MYIQAHAYSSCLVETITWNTQTLIHKTRDADTHTGRLINTYSVGVPVCLCLSVCLCMCLHVCLYVCLSVCLCVFVCTCLSVCMYVCVCVCMCLSLCLSYHHWTPIGPRLPWNSSCVYGSLLPNFSTFGTFLALTTNTSSDMAIRISGTVTTTGHKLFVFRSASDSVERPASMSRSTRADGHSHSSPTHKQTQTTRRWETGSGRQPAVSTVRRLSECLEHTHTHAHTGGRSRAAGGSNTQR